MVKRACIVPGCPALASEGSSKCDEHQAKQSRQNDVRRSHVDWRAWYRTPRWRRLKKAFIAEHPFCECEDCKRRKVVKEANVVNHIKPHRGDEVLFWDQRNWQAMNDRCHNRHTARYDGGFGN